MTNLQKTKEVLSLIVTAASALVSLADIWKTVEPKVKRIVVPFLEQCKTIANDDTKDKIDLEIKEIEKKDN